MKRERNEQKQQQIDEENKIANLASSHISFNNGTGGENFFFLLYISVCHPTEEAVSGTFGFLKLEEHTQNTLTSMKRND